MANPSTPALASFPVPPPVFNFPWGTVQPNGSVMLTAMSIQFLQLLWAAIQGGGGVIDLSLIGIPEPGTAIAAADQAVAADYRALAELGAAKAEIVALDQRMADLTALVLQRGLWAGAGIFGAMPTAWGVTFSCQDISTKPINTVIGRVPIPFAWTLPATTSSPAGYAVGEVTGAPSAQTDFPLLKDGVSVATLRFASSGHSPTLIKASDTAFVQGDYVDLQTPSNLNGMSGAFGVAAMGVR